MTCLRAEVDNMDSYRSLVSTLWCVVCRPRQYKTGILFSCNHACIVCSCCAMFLKELNVRSTFDGGRSSYIVV